MKSIQDVYKRKCKQRKNSDRLQFIEELQKDDRKAVELGLPWRLMVSVVIERLPVVIDDPLPWEKDYYDLRDMLDTYGKDFPEELGIIDPGHDNPSEEELLAELAESGFVPAPRITEADKTGDRKTMERALSESLYLMISLAKPRPGPMGRWGFPQGLLKPEENMRQAAERVAIEQLGQKMELFWLSNAPDGWTYHVFNEALRAKANAYGEKVWFYRAELIGGQPVIHSRIQDHAWAKRSEFEDYVPKDLAGYLQQVLL